MLLSHDTLPVLREPVLDERKERFRRELGGARLKKPVFGDLDSRV